MLTQTVRPVPVLEGNWSGKASVIEGPDSMDGAAVVTLDYTLQVSPSNGMGKYTATVTESNMTCSNPKMECKPMPPQTWRLTCSDNMISIPTAFYGKFRGVLYDNNSQIRLVSKGSTYVMELKSASLTFYFPIFKKIVDVAATQILTES